MSSKPSVAVKDKDKTSVTRKRKAKEPAKTGKNGQDNVNLDPKVVLRGVEALHREQTAKDAGQVRVIISSLSRARSLYHIHNVERLRVRCERVCVCVCVCVLLLLLLMLE